MHHQYSLPNFLGRKCLKKDTSREIEYDFGEELYFQSLADLRILCKCQKKNKRHFEDIYLKVVLAGKDSELRLQMGLNV